jgi:hypothetical protein
MGESRLRSPRLRINAPFWAKERRQMGFHSGILQVGADALLALVILGMLVDELNRVILKIRRMLGR